MIGSSVVDLLNRLKGHRTYLAALLLVLVVAARLALLPDDLFVQGMPHIMYICFGLAALLLLSKLGTAVQHLTVKYSNAEVSVRAAAGSADGLAGQSCACPRCPHRASTA